MPLCERFSVSQQVTFAFGLHDNTVSRAQAFLQLRIRLSLEIIAGQDGGSPLNRSRSGLLFFAIAAFVAVPALSHAQDTVTTQTVKMVMVRANLSKTLDAKKTKVNDPVAAKLMYDGKFQDGTVLPRNTVLSGHVDRVQPSEKKSDSLIQVTLDKAVLKDGKVIPIKATIMKLHALVSPFASVAGGDSGTSVSPSSAAPADSQSGADGVNGVTLQSDVDQSFSGIFQSSGRNVRLSGGTEMDIAIGELPAKTQSQ